MGSAASVPSKSIESWSPEIVASLVSSMGTAYEGYGAIFISEGINGKVILANNSNAELIEMLADVGITNKIHVKNICAQFESVKNAAGGGNSRDTPVVLEQTLVAKEMGSNSSTSNTTKSNIDAQQKPSIMLSTVQEGANGKRELELANCLRDKHGYDVWQEQERKRKKSIYTNDELYECMASKIHTVIICVSRLYSERFDKLLEARAALSLQEKHQVDVLYVLMEENFVADDELLSKLPQSLPKKISDDVNSGAVKLIKSLASNVLHPLWEDDHVASTAAVLANLIGDKGKLATNVSIGGDDDDILPQTKLDEMEVKTDMRLNPFDAQDPPYPMYVMRCKDLVEQDLSELPPHEKALEMGLLWEVVQTTPGKYHLFKSLPNGDRGEQLKTLMNKYDAVLHRARFLAISHQWLRPQLGHPDSSDHRKLFALKTHFNTTGLDNLEDYLWMDYFSIPQDPHRRDKQILGIKSLPCYFMYASTILILSESWERLTDKTNGYLSRGHCLMEMSKSMLPRIDMYGKWYIPGSDSSGSWGTCQSLSLDGTLKSVGWNDFVDAGSPLCGNYTKEEDRAVYLPIMRKYCDAFEAFDSLFLQRVRQCSTWRQTGMQTSDGYNSGLGACLQRLDGGVTEEQEMAPSDWADSVLPPGYIDALSASLADGSHCPKCDNLRVG